MNEKDELEEMFAGKMRDWQHDPPTEVWEGINKKLTQRKSRRIFLYVSSAAAILLLMLIPAGQWLLWNEPAGKQQLTETLDQQHPQYNTKTAEPQLLQPKETTPTPSTDHLHISPKSVAEKKTAVITHIAQNEMVELLQIETDDANGLVVEDARLALAENETSDADPTQKLNLAEAVERAQRAALASQLLSQSAEFDLEQAKRNDKLAAERLNLLLAYGSVPGGTITASELLNVNNNVRYRADSYQSGMAYETSFYGEIERTDVQPPLTFGFKLSYQATQHLFLESGLSYTSLGVINKTTELNENYAKYFRTMHYLGIPLGLRWELIQTKPIKVYLMQSVVIEKGIRISNRKSHYEKNELIWSELSWTRIPGVQLSTLSAVGADLNIYQNFSVFGEGGVQVFYLNKTQPFNMRSANMLWPVFQTGIRLNL